MTDNNSKIKNYGNLCFENDIKIIDIRNNEHFGDALMFLNEPCPLVAKVRTRTAELFILRKIEAIEIYSIYPNIWRRINKKSLFNMDQIYLKIRKIILELAERYNIKIEQNYFNKPMKKKSIEDSKKSEGNNKIKRHLINKKSKKLFEEIYNDENNENENKESKAQNKGEESKTNQNTKDNSNKLITIEIPKSVKSLSYLSEKSKSDI